MHDQPTEDDPAAEEHRLQRYVLNIVVDTDQSPWSIEEIARALDGGAKRFLIEDAVNQLQVIGLLNHAEGMMFATQAAANIQRLRMLAL